MKTQHFLTFNPTKFTTLCLDRADFEMARDQAERRGVEYGTYVKMLAREALLNAKT